MRASNEKKVDLAKEILLAYIAHSPEDSRDVDKLCEAAKKIFDAVDEIVETTKESGSAGFHI